MSDVRTAAEPETLGVSQTQEQTTSMVTEITQKIDVEKLTDEDVDEMILETDVDDDAQQNESESDAVADRHDVPPEDQDGLY